LIREELQRDKLRGRASNRAWGFEKRLEERRGSELARECREEVKNREEGRSCFEERKVRIEQKEEKRGKKMVSGLRRREKGREKKNEKR